MEANMKRFALALLLAITAGCGGAMDSEQVTDARLTEAQQILQEARATAAGLDDEKLKSFVLLVIALWQTQARDAPGALATAALFQEAEMKAVILIAIAAGQTSAGDPAAERAWQQAQQAAATTPDASKRASMLQGIALVRALAQAKAGEVRPALEAVATIDKGN